MSQATSNLDLRSQTSGTPVPQPAQNCLLWPKFASAEIA